MTRSFYSIEEL